MYFVYTVNNITYKSSGFFDTDIVEFERGYQCLASQEHKLHNLTDQHITASVTVRDFQVQAFVFKKANEFGNCEILALSLSLSLSFYLSLFLSLSLSLSLFLFLFFFPLVNIIMIDGIASLYI